MECISMLMAPTGKEMKNKLHLLSFLLHFGGLRWEAMPHICTEEMMGEWHLCTIRELS